jgi:flagellar protein FlbT
MQENIQKGGTMALHIKMKDGEKVVVNGAVFVSQGNSHVILENRASVLHSREVMSPKEATTNARKLYFACMLAYIDQSNVEQYRDRIPLLLRDLVELSIDAEAKATCVRVATLIARNEYYEALAECRQLIKYEDDHLCKPVNEAA